MQNLVKIQEELKNVPLQAVMAYVNGRNPMVPPYLALTELNRRKQVQQSAQAQQAQPQATVKDQIQQQAGIMALQNQRAQAGTENMMQKAMAVPQPGAVPANAPVQGAPAQAPTVQAAEGGLMSARISPAMFNRNNFAGGGIVAFAGPDGSSVEDKELTDEEKKALAENEYLQRSRALADLPSALVRGIEKYNPFTGTAYREGIKRFVNQPVEDQAKEFRKASMRPEGAPSAIPTATERQAAADTKAAQDLANFDAATAAFEKERAAAVPSVVAKAPGAPAGAPVAVAPKAGLPALKAPSDLYGDEADKLQKLKERFGVKDNITTESDKMLADLKARIQEQRGQQGIEAIGQAMAEGAKGKKWYEAASGFGKGYFDTTAKQRELNNKQDEAFLNYQTAKEKEDDARRRGNVKDVVEAADKTQKLKIDMMNAESNRILAMKPSQLAEQVQLYSKNPELFNRLYPKENPLVVSAAKHYFDNEMMLKKEYPTVNDYVAAKVTGGGIAAGTGAQASAGPKEGDKSTSKSGKPIIYKNGKWEYA